MSHRTLSMINSLYTYRVKTSVRESAVLAELREKTTSCPVV